MQKFGSQFLRSFAARKRAAAATERSRSNEAKRKTKFTEGKGHLTGGANIFHWWENGGGWWGISPLLNMLTMPWYISNLFLLLSLF